MEFDSRRTRGECPFLTTNLKTCQRLPQVVAFIEREGPLPPAKPAAR